MTRYFKIIKNLWLLIKGVKRNALVALVILLFKGLTEGVGLLFVIPLLAIAGVAEVQASNSGLVKGVQTAFVATGFSITVTSVLIAYFVIMCFYALLNYTQSVITTKINKRVVDSWRGILFEKITYAKWSSIQKIKSSDLQALLVTDIRRFSNITNQSIQLVGTLILVSIYIMLSFLLSYQLTLLALIPLAVLLLLNKPINKKTYQLGKESVKHNKSMQSTILEHLSAVKLVKSYQKEQEHLEEFATHSLATERQMVDYVKASGKTKLLFEVLSALVIVIYIFVAVNLLQLPVSETLLLVFIFARLLPRISRIAGSFQQILNNMPSFESILKTIDQLKAKDISAGTNTTALKNELRIKDVSFAYDSQHVLSSFNAAIPANKTTLILGPSGAGKSTLIDLIMGLQQPTKGEIMVDGISLKTINQNDWRSKIALVPQDAFLFNDTIKENVRWSKPEVTQQEIELALKQAGAYEFVNQLSKGLETVVGDRGMSLSGGERQRIALARALLRKPQLLILDEATNAVDDKSEELIAVALSELKGEMTIVMVAHRSTLIKLADQVVELN